MYFIFDKIDFVRFIFLYGEVLMRGQHVRIEGKSSKEEVKIESKISTIGVDDLFEVNGMHLEL